MTEKQKQTQTTLFPIRGTVVLMSLLLPMFYWGHVLKAEEGLDKFNYVLLDALSIIYYQLTAALLLLIWVKYWKVDVRHMWMKFNSKHVSTALQLTLIQMLFSFTSVFVLFYLLSLEYPEFVTDRLENAPHLIHYINGELNLVLNSLYFLSVIVLAPVVEEFVFRGLLLRRWSEKWSPKKAMVVSSLIFAILHGDPIGAFLLGIVLCYVYFLSGSLWLPILCHVLNNFIVWLMSLIFSLVDGPGQEYEFDIETMANDWYIGVLTAVIGLIWLWIYLKKNTKPTIPSKYPL